MAITEPTYFISELALRSLKQYANGQIPFVGSSHLSECLACALGFKTHAALIASFAGKSTVRCQIPCNHQFVKRLHELGYREFRCEDRFLPPEFVTIASRANVRKGVRWKVWRNLVFTAVNAGLEQKMFGLNPGANWWPGASFDLRVDRNGLYQFTLNNGMSAVVSVSHHPSHELRVQILVNPRVDDIKPELHLHKYDGDAYAYCWLERKLGAWVQEGGSHELHCKRMVMSKLAEMSVEPMGYSNFGCTIY